MAVATTAAPAPTYRFGHHKQMSIWHIIGPNDQPICRWTIRDRCDYVFAATPDTDDPRDICQHCAGVQQNRTHAQEARSVLHRSTPPRLTRYGTDAWRRQPITERQLQALEELGIPRTDAEHFNRGAAHDRIATLREANASHRN